MTQILGFRNGQRLREVKALSPHHRFVIVLHSPDGVAETGLVKTLSAHHRFVIALHSPDGVAESGLCVCPPEKSARKLAFGVRRDTFSSAV